VKVKNWMAKNVVTIDPDATLQEAIELMHQYSIRHLPVIENGKMVGLVTESNLRQYLVSEIVEDLLLRDVMIMNPITIDQNASIDLAAKLIYNYKIGGLPVLGKRKLVGILTISDILNAFIELFGLLQESSRIDLVLDEQTGGLDNVIRLIREYGGNVISVGVETQAARKNKIYYIRLEKRKLGPIIEAIEGMGHKIVSVLE